MESNIVKDFQNLRVFSNRHSNRMDELVQDLSNALEETSKGCARGCNQDSPVASGGLTRRHHKRRRAARRANGNLYWKRGTISEASESSVEEAGRDYLDNIVTHSDSDDLSLVYPKQRLMVPMSEPVPPVESDSFTENLSPLRPQRRRRRFRHMGVESLQTISQAGGGVGEGCTKGSNTPTSMPCSSTEHKHQGMHHSQCHSLPGSSLCGGGQGILPGKRKRGSKNQQEVSTMEHMSSRDKHTADTDNMDIASMSQESSSLSSSEFDSDVHNNADEGREADDEQSDFFHEPDACSGSEVTPWWDTEVEGLMEGDMDATQEFDNILSGAFSYMSTASRKKFRQRVDKLLARAESGREIRIGRRKLKGKMPRYTMMRFLQDQERWSSMQGAALMASQFSPGASWNSGYSSQSGDYKRLRQTPPPPLDPTEEAGGVGGGAIPIPETNIGNRMLRNMGWMPGSGLGAEGDGCTDPVVAYTRRDRKGLGYETQSDT